MVKYLRRCYPSATRARGAFLPGSSGRKTADWAQRSNEIVPISTRIATTSRGVRYKRYNPEGVSSCCGQGKGREMTEGLGRRQEGLDAQGEGEDKDYVTIEPKRSD
jgi:hypothetical protein